MKKIILLFIVVSSLSTNLFAQMHDIKFKRLYEGLSQSSVSCILQDRKGFMWFGTVGGLNRYDGAEFIVYKNVSNDTTSLSANWVLDILESSKGNLWIATADGLNMFDRDKNKFVRYVHKKEDKGSLSHNVVNTILEDSRGNLWVGTDQGGLDMFNKKDNNFIHYRNDNKDRRSLSSNTVYCLYEDRKGNLWIGTRDGQLNLFDRNTRSFTQFKFDNGGASNLNPGRFRKIVEDNQGKFWVGTQDNGLFSIESYSAGHIKYRQYVHDANDVNSLLNNHILSMHLDKTGYLWIGIENGGLEIFNIEKKTLKHYKNDPNDESSISSNSIWSIYQDPIGRIWIGTFDKGLNLIDRYYEKFITYRRQANNRNSLSNENVSKFLEDKHGNLWIATDGGGLNYFNRDKKSFEHFRHNENNKNSLSSDAVLGLYEDKEENLWVGTWAGWIDVLSKDRKTFKHYNTGNGSLLSNNVYTMINDNKGNILIATNSGLNVYDPKKKRFFTYIHNESDENSLSFNAIIQLYRDSKDQIWIGTEGSGLDLMKKDKLGKVSFAHYRNDPTEPSTLSNNIVESIYEDSYHNIWIGTSNGLNLMNRESGTFTIFRKEDGLPDNAIQGILEDNQGTLWLSTLKGLSRFNFKTKTFRNYDVSDGLQGNEFNGRAAMKSRNGEMFFGGRQGFNIVHSESILENPFVPPVYLTDFKIFNKSMNIGTEGSPLKKSIAETKEITLSYTQSVFSFDFAALNYTHPEKNQYAYMMEGFDKEWNYIGIKRTATYTNLDPGEYVFRVKASNNDGIWNEKGASLSIRITPPFWRTYWFYVILFAIIACVIFLFYQSRIRARELAEQRRMDEAIAKERNLLRMVIDNLPDAIYVKDTNCRKTIANVADVNYMGLQSEAEAIGKDDFDVFPKEMAEEFYAGDQSVIQTGNSVFTKEGYVYDKQGQIRWLATTKLPLRDNEGKIIGLVGIGRDITERKLAEEALQKERNLLRTLIDNLPDSIYVKDVNCRKTIANLTEVHYMGLQSEAEAIGKDDFDIYPKELADGFYADDQSVIQTGKAVVNREEYVIDEQGQKRWLATSKLPLRNEKGQTIGLIGIGRDITKRKLAEEALQKERYLLRTLIDILPDSIYVKDTNYRKTIANVADVHNMGLQSEAEAIGKDDFDIYPKELADGFYADDQSVIQTGKAVVNREEYIIDKQGQKRWLNTSKLPLRDAEGQTIGLVGVGRDITERKKADEALRESEERFRIIAEQTGRLVYDYRFETGIIKWAGAIQDVTGYTPNEHRNSTIFDWRNNIHPEDRERAVSLIDEANKTIGHYLIEYRYRRRDGEYIHIEDQGVSLKNESGKVERVLGAIENITERKRTVLERERLIKELQDAVADIKVLSGLVPICSNCKKIRDDKGYWTQLEGYIQAHSQAKFSHGVCPDCMVKLYPNYIPKKKE